MEVRAKAPSFSLQLEGVFMGPNLASPADWLLGGWLSLFTKRPLPVASDIIFMDSSVRCPAAIGGWAATRLTGERPLPCLPLPWQLRHEKTCRHHRHRRGTFWKAGEQLGKKFMLFCRILQFVGNHVLFTFNLGKYF